MADAVRVTRTCGERDTVVVGEVDPDDDSVDRWIVRRYAYDPNRHERRHIIIAAFDNEFDFEACILSSWLELEAKKATGQGEPGDHITGIHLEPGSTARKRARRIEAKAFMRGASYPRRDG